MWRPEVYLLALLRFTRQIWILTSDEWRNLLYRRRALIALILYLLATLLLVMAIGKIEGWAVSVLPQMGDISVLSAALQQRMQSAGLGRAYNFLLSLGDLPAAIVFLQLLGLLFYPTIVSLISCDSIASDIQLRTIRFLLTRTGRITYFFGKLTAHLALYTALYALTMAAVVLTCAHSAHDFNFSYYFRSALLYFAVFVPFLWFLTAMTQLLSCSAKRPAQVIWRLHMLWFLFIFLAYYYPPASPFESELMLGLLVPGRGGLGGVSAWGLCGWSLGFTLLGLLSLRRRAL